MSGQSTLSVSTRENTKDVIKPVILKKKCARDKEAREKEESTEERIRKEEKEWAKNMRNDPTYKKLTAIVKRLEKNEQKVFEKRETEDESVKDDHMVHEVYVLGCTKDGKRLAANIDDWDRGAESRGQVDICQADYIISTEPRTIGSALVPDYVLVKYFTYPLPTWQGKEDVENTAELDEYELRTARLDFVEFMLRQLEGDDDFSIKYPHRYLSWENGQGHGGYIQSELGRYKNRLRAIEHRWTLICKKWGLPSVFIEDWTKEKCADEELERLVYMQTSILGAEVQDLLKGRDKLKHIACGGRCKNSCNGRLRNASARFCCSLDASIEKDEHDDVHFTKKGKSKWEGVRPRFECTSACKCDPKKCKNRLLQRGRQHPLLIFRDPVKGWTIRVLTEMDWTHILGEYVGEYQLEPSNEASPAKAYDFEMSYRVERPKGEAEPLYVVAYDKGNETRLISHSCQPNVSVQSVIVARNGLFFCSIAFFPNRLLLRGEESSFDYFNKRGLETTGCSLYFPYCGCRSPICRFTKEKVEAARHAKRLRENEEHEENESEKKRARQDAPSKLATSADNESTGGNEMPGAESMRDFSMETLNQWETTL